ncbi:26092_t:CDS:2 [Gigaspora margarita]|uniref:26092_t:CDS:1 n=1 Tax=Gigaspora margarita TaxID=4874 RepID=A0ABN7V0D4_GIGMA|nr:26092_t:CDS:2 [Gigaspora margarita]
MKTREYFTGNFSNNNKYFMVDDIQDYVNPQTDEYLIKSKVVGTNNLHTYVLISGFSVYFEIKINEVDDPKNIKVDYQKVKDVYCEIKNYQNAKVLNKTHIDLKNTPCVFMRMEFINHFKRKKEIQRLRNLIKEKKIDFELYKDDISTSYLMFISVRTRVKFLDSDKKVAFLLSGSFSMYSTLSKNMFSNIFYYSTLMFYNEINNDHFLSIYWDLETVKMNQLRAMDHNLRKILKAFKSDTAFMGVYCFFWGSEVKLFYIIAILLINDEFAIGYMNPNEDLVDLIEVRTQQEFLKTMFQIYKNFNPEKESRCCMKKSKNIESVIRYHQVVEQVKISASETATHYFMKTDRTVHYDMQTQSRQHFKTLQNWKLNDILKKMGLNPKEDLSIKEMYDIIIKCRNSEYDEGAKKKRSNSIYGQFWSKPSFFRNYMISSSVTAFGRDYLVKVSDFAESRLLKRDNSLKGFLKIFFKIVNNMVTESYKRYEEFEREINSWIGNKSPKIVIEFEKLGIPIFYQSKKKYAMLMYTDSNYYFDNNWIGVEDYYKEKYGTWDNEDKLIYTIFDLDKYDKYLNDLKFTKIEQYFDFINEFDQENIWMKHVCSKLTEEFISYLYKKETELSIKLFEMMGRNNIEDDDEEISLIDIVETDAFKKNNWKYTDRKIILYEKNRELDFSLVRNTKKEDYNSDPQDKDEEDFEESEDEDESEFDDNNELVLYKNNQEIKDVDNIKNYIKENIKNSVRYLDNEKLIYKNEIDIKKERVRKIEDWYLVDKDFIYKNTTLKQASFTINGEKSGLNQIKLVDQFDPKIHMIDKYHYLKGVKSFLFVCLEMSEKKVEKFLIDLINRYTNDISMMNKYVSNSSGIIKKRKPKVDILVRKILEKKRKITDYFKKDIINKDEDPSYSVYICLETGYLSDKFPKNKNGGYSYKRFYSTIEASKFGTKIQQFNNQLKNRRDDKDPKYFVFDIFQLQKNKITAGTNISVHRLKDLNFRNSDLEFVDYVRSTNIDLFSISYEAILKLVKNEKYKDKNITIISKNISFLVILRYKFYFWKRNNFKNRIDIVTNGEDFDGLSDTELDEKMSEYSDHKDVEILKEIFLNIKKNNIIIDGDLGFKSISNIDFIFKKVKQNSKKIK